MPTLSQHQSSKFVKLLNMGDPSSGKTGALTPLVEAGYKLAIWDFDNGLDSLFQFVRNKCPDKLGNVHYMTLRDKFKQLNNDIVYDGIPTAFSTALKLLDNWSPPQADESLGKPGCFGPEWICVFDTLSFFSDSCYRYFDAMNPGAKDKRQIYFLAQTALAEVFDLLTSSNFQSHVIVNAHLTYDVNQYGAQKAFARTVGSALNGKISSWFNGAVLTETQGSGKDMKRQIRFPSNGIVDLRNPAPFKLTQDTLPISTALADYFKAVLSS